MLICSPSIFLTHRLFYFDLLTASPVQRRINDLVGLARVITMLVPWIPAWLTHWVCQGFPSLDCLVMNPDFSESTVRFFSMTYIQHLPDRDALYQDHTSRASVPWSRRGTTINVPVINGVPRILMSIIATRVISILQCWISRYTNAFTMAPFFVPVARIHCVKGFLLSELARDHCSIFVWLVNFEPGCKTERILKANDVELACTSLYYLRALSRPLFFF